MPKRFEHHEYEAEAAHRREVGRRIQLALLDKGMIQAQLADAMNVTSSVVATWISGRYGISTYRLSKVSDITECGDLLPTRFAHRRVNPAQELGEMLLKKLGGTAARRLLALPDDLLASWVRLLLRSVAEMPAPEDPQS